MRIQKLHRSRLGRTRTTKGLTASGRLPVGQRQQRPARRKTLAIAPAAELTLRVVVGELLRQAANRGADPGACVDPFRQQLGRLNPRPGEAAWLCDVAAEEAGTVLTELAEAAEDGSSSAAAEGGDGTAAATAAAAAEGGGGGEGGTAATDRVLRALNAMVAAVEAALLQPPTVCTALFWGEQGVSERSRVAFCKMLASATTSLDVAIFSISDDRIEKALRDAHRRGVAVRVISDDETALNSGSKLFSLAKEGIATAIDSTIDVRARGGKVEALSRHMHHKFALVDGRLLLTGSYNWTYSAASVNCENALATDDMFFVGRFATEFARMWKLFHAKTRCASNVRCPRPCPEHTASCVDAPHLLYYSPAGARGGAQDSKDRARPSWPAAVCCPVACSRARGAAATRQGRLSGVGWLPGIEQVIGSRAGTGVSPSTPSPLVRR